MRNASRLERSWWSSESRVQGVVSFAVEGVVSFGVAQQGKWLDKCGCDFEIKRW